MAVGPAHRPMPNMVRGSGGGLGRPEPRQGYGVLTTSGLPGRQGMADEPHPVSARLFKALGGGKPRVQKMPNASFKLGGARGLPVPFHRQPGSFTGAPSRFGNAPNRTGARAGGNFGHRGY
jgi:hypothetical protein